MSQPPTDGVEPKSRKARVAKSPKSQDAKSKVKISAYISVESARRLGIHATMTDQDRSTIIDALIRDNLRDWVVQYRPAPRGVGEAATESEPQPVRAGAEGQGRRASEVLAALDRVERPTSDGACDAAGNGSLDAAEFNPG